jgi:hypothetical protein
MNIYNLPVSKSQHYLNRYIKLMNTLSKKIIDIGESHHILPVSMGGNNDESNLIKLEHRTHVLAHWLLWKAYETYETARAFNMSVVRGKYNHQRKNTKIRQSILDKAWRQGNELYSGNNHPFYGKERPEHSKIMTGTNNPDHDPTIYTFYNYKLGLVETCTKYELRTKYNIDSTGSMAALVNGRKKTCSGWSMTPGPRVINKVSRLEDRKEMDIGNFKLWEKRNPLS